MNRAVVDALALEGVGRVLVRSDDRADVRETREGALLVQPADLGVRRPADGTDWLGATLAEHEDRQRPVLEYLLEAFDVREDAGREQLIRLLDIAVAGEAHARE